MSAPAGNNFNPNGRPKGSINETARRVKEVFAYLLEGQTEDLVDALNKLKQQNPKAYLELYVKISERFVPQVSRNEISGLDGEPFQPIQIILPTKKDE